MSEAGARLIEELMRFRPEGLTPNGWAVRAGVSRTIWADIRRHGNPSRRTLEKLLGAAGSSLAEFEAMRVDHSAAPIIKDNQLADPSRGWRGALLPAIPLLASSLVGEWGASGSGIDLLAVDRSRIVGWVERPGALAADSAAYAVAMAGESMWPRFRPGRRLLVAPSASVEVGGDVLVELGDGRVLIKELADWSTAQTKLRQFSPDVTFAVAGDEIRVIHVVMGEAIG